MVDSWVLQAFQQHQEGLRGAGDEVLGKGGEGGGVQEQVGGRRSEEGGYGQAPHLFGGPDSALLLYAGATPHHRYASLDLMALPLIKEFVILKQGWQGSGSHCHLESVPTFPPPRNLPSTPSLMWLTSGNIANNM